MTLPITGHTRLFGILADPIGHVRTPQGMNALFQEQGINGTMVPLHVNAQELPRLVDGLRVLRSFDGMVVTVPHKTAMRALCDSVTPAAQRIGAVNVVHRTPKGMLVGDMLDGEGFVAGLRQEGLEPHGLRVYLAGAGGAASAIAFALAGAGVRQLTIANRSADKARQLAERVALHYPGLRVALGSRDPAGHELVVNATSLGLKAGDAVPFEVQKLSPQQTVAEIVMEPALTPLLAQAQALGCRIHMGAAMLQNQLQLMAHFMQFGRAQ